MQGAELVKCPPGSLGFPLGPASLLPWGQCELSSLLLLRQANSLTAQIFWQSAVMGKEAEKRPVHQEFSKLGHWE